MAYKIDNAPRYTAFSTDIVDDKISGINYAGAIVYLIDKSSEKIVNGDGTLSDYNHRISSGYAKTYATITRPNDNTPYLNNDVVGTSPASNIVFNNVSVISGSSFMITTAMLEIDVNAIPTGMSGFRLHLYNVAPTAISDNTTFNLIADDRSKYLGFITFSAPNDFGDTLWSQSDSVNFAGSLASTSTTIYGILETLGGFTPTAQTVIKVSLNIIGI